MISSRPKRKPWHRSAGAGLLAALLWTAPGRAIDPEKSLDQLVHKSWTTADGLPQNAVLDIVQTCDGYLWLATFGGLARFDGQKFTVFDVAASPGLRSNRITALHEDADGVLWLGSERGFVCRREDERFDCLGVADGLPRGVVWSLLEDLDGALWIATSNGLARLAEGRIRTFSESDGLRGATEALVLDRQDNLWVGTAGGLARWRGDRFELRQIPSLFGHATPHAAVADPRGDLWVTMHHGVLKLHDGEMQVIVEPPPSGMSFGDILHDRDGNLWFTNHGVGRFRAGSLVDDGERLLQDGRLEVRVLYEDGEGNIWIGTSSHGLHLLRDGIFSSHLHPMGSAGGGILESASGEVVFGTFCQGVHLLAGKDMSRIDRPESGLGCVNSLLEDRRGRLWAGGGVLGLREGNSWTRFTATDGAFVRSPVRALFEDRRGVVWVGADQGLASFADGRFTPYTSSDGLKIDDVRLITEDSRGNLWLAGPYGLMRFAGAEIAPRSARHFTVSDGLPHNFVRAVYEDASGGLWIGTYGGGMAYLDPDGDVFTTLTRAHGLPENAVSSIVEDDAGNFWMSGNRGITRLRRAEAEAFVRGETDRVHAVLYDEVDGMIPSETSGGFQPAAWKARDGRIWYPTIRGVAVVDPAKLRLGAPPPVAVERVRVGRREVEARSTVIVPPGDWDLEIEYTGLQLGLPAETRFRYRLVEHDPDWVEVGARRTAYYTKVPPGTYRFEVTAAAYAGGPWNEGPATFDIVFRPFLYQILWFQISAALAAVGLIVLGFTVHIRGLRRHARELASTIAELEAKNAEMERFTYTVSHDLKAPLVTIQGFSGMLRKDARAGNPKRVDDDIERIQAAGAQMGRLLDDLLELSRIGRLMSTPQEVPLSEVAREARELVTGRLGSVEVEIAGDLPTVLGDRPRLVEVFQNLFENAARFMGDEVEPRIVVGHRRDAEETVVYVRDNGVGIAPEYHDKVFGLFERLDTQTEGTGIGLAIVKRIVEFHGGRIWVESEGLRRGSTFCFTLPCKCAPTSRPPLET